MLKRKPGPVVCFGDIKQGGRGKRCCILSWDMWGAITGLMSRLQLWLLQKYSRWWWRRQHVELKQPNRVLTQSKLALQELSKARHVKQWTLGPVCYYSKPHLFWLIQWMKVFNHWADEAVWVRVGQGQGGWWEGRGGRADQWLSDYSWMGARSSGGHCRQLYAGHFERPEDLQVSQYKQRMAEETGMFALIYALPSVFLCGYIVWYALNMHNFYALVCQSDE